MIYITGDTHGEIDINKLANFFKKRYVSKKDYLIILGDAGIVWDEKSLEEMISIYKSLGLTIFYIDGNHENFYLLNKFPVVSKNNALVHVITDGIYHVLRGELLIINRLKFLCIGGAESTDKDRRVPGLSWWKEETITEYDINNALINVSECNYNADYILTHTAPTKIVESKLKFKSNESSKQLDKILEKVKFDKWYFGHFHTDKSINSKFRCFYNDVIEIQNMDYQKEMKYKALRGFSSFNPSNNYPYLSNWETGKIVKITEKDLPEWYFKSFSYYPFYYCLKGVVDIAYTGSPFDNHISKDSRIYLSYDSKIDKNKDYSPINKDKYIYTYRTNIVSFTLGLEKYSPNLNLNKLKEKINLTYDQYNRNSSNYHNGVYKRPFPNIKTKTIKGIKYRVIEENNILCEFFNLESAKKYSNTYISKNLKIKMIRIIKKDDENIEYDTSHNPKEWLRIEAIK